MEINCIDRKNQREDPLKTLEGTQITILSGFYPSLILISRKSCPFITLSPHLPLIIFNTFFFLL